MTTFAAPQKVMEVVGSRPDGFIQTFGEEVMKESHHIQERRLPGRVRTHQDLEWGQLLFHVTQAAVPEGLDAADHGRGSAGTVLPARGITSLPSRNPFRRAPRIAEARRSMVRQPPPGFRPVPGEWYRYLDYMDGQLRELLTNYGEIAGIWFDGWWDRPKADWRLHKTYKMIHDLQPQTLICCNHHVLPFPGEDYQAFEKDLPGENTAGFNKDARIGDLPLEYCDTISKSWGYDANEKDFKTVEYLIQRMVKAAGRNCNFVLNVGPKPDGTIQDEFVERFAKIGEWMKANGETIHGTRGGPIPPRPWGVSTQKGDRVFVHVLDWPYAELALPLADRKVTRIRSFRGGKEIPFRQSELGVLVTIPDEVREKVDTILVIEGEK